MEKLWILFRFRVRMAPFGENFRGGTDGCLPTVQTSPDGQAETFAFDKRKQIIDIKGKYQQIFGWKFTPELISVFTNLEKNIEKAYYSLPHI